MNAADYANQAGDVFVLPDTCLKIKDIIDNKISDLDEISALIALDPALASRLLKLANSALYNFPNQVDSVNKAVLLLGETQVYNLVVAYGATEAFAKLPNDVIDLERFWEQSMHCALMAKYFGAKLGIKQQEPLYLSGLLHNIGELVVAEINPPVAQVLNLYKKGTLPWSQQQQLLGFSYADCSVELLKCWNLPGNIIEPLRHLNQPQLTAGFLSYEQKIELVVHLAARLAFLNSAAAQFELTEVVDKNVAELLQLSRNDVKEARDYAFLEALSILSLLNPRSSMII